MEHHHFIVQRIIIYKWPMFHSYIVNYQRVIHCAQKGLNPPPTKTWRYIVRSENWLKGRCRRRWFKDFLRSFPAQVTDFSGSHWFCRRHWKEGKSSGRRLWLCGCGAQQTSWPCMARSMVRLRGSRNMDGFRSRCFLQPIHKSSRVTLLHTFLLRTALWRSTNHWVGNES